MSDTLTQLRQAVASLQAGDLGGAIGKSQAILRKEPRNFDALHIVALASYHARDLATALRNVEAALAVRSDMADAFNTHGLILRALSRPAEAADQFARAVKLNGRSREAHYNLANCRQDLGQYPAALEHYDAALRIDPAMLVAWNNRGLVLARMGRMADAAASFTEAIRRSDGFAPAFYNRADALASLRRFDDALRDYDRAIALKPDFAEAHCNRANALLELGRVQEALAGYDRAIGLLPRFHQAQLSRGIALANLGRPAEAEESFRKALALRPDYVDAHYNLGKVLKEQGRAGEAVESYDLAIALRPNHAEAYGNRGNALKDLKRPEEALSSYDKAIALKPDLAEAHSNRGTVLCDLLRLDAALAAHDQAIALRPQTAEFHSNRGNTLKEMNRLEAALVAFDAAIALRPDYAEAYSNRGNALRELGRLDEARDSFDTALGLSPCEAGMRYNKSIVALQAHDFREGFDLYRDRWKTDEFDGRVPDTGIPAWDGGVPAGRLLLWAEQGIGDEVFYASLLSLLNRQRLQVTVSADRRLHPIYARSFPGLPLLGRDETTRAIAGGFAAQAPIGDLGHFLGIDAAAVARRRYPYLVAGPERMQRLQAANPVFGSRPVCGISWRSGNRRMGSSRSIGLGDLAPVFAGLPYGIVNLQYGDVAGEIGEARERLGPAVHVLEDLDLFNDLDGLLAAIALCDVVLTIDNVTAHFAGALGKRAIVLVPTGKGRYWYWGGERQSLWYPSLDLVYQDSIDDWGSALAAASALLASMDGAPAGRYT